MRAYLGLNHKGLTRGPHLYYWNPFGLNVLHCCRAEIGFADSWIWCIGRAFYVGEVLYLSLLVGDYLIEAGVISYRLHYEVFWIYEELVHVVWLVMGR